MTMAWATRRGRRALWVAGALSLAACGDAARVPDAGALPDAGVWPDAGEDAGQAPAYLTELRSPEDYASFALDGELRYLAPLAGAEPRPPLDAPCVFQDMRQHAFHIQFLKTLSAYEDVDLQAYLAMVLHKESRVFYGGMLKHWPSVRHPRTGKRGVISYGAYQEDVPASSFTNSEWVTLHERLVGCVPYARELLVLVPDGTVQAGQLRSERATLAELGVPVVLPEELRAGLGAEVYSEGQAYGYLHIVPRGVPITEYSSRQVLIASSAPNDISLVAGLITEHPQSMHSHVSLRLREKGVPSASVPDIYDNALIASLDGQLVHVVTQGSSVRIEPARLRDAQLFWEAMRPKLPALTSDLSVQEPRGFAELRNMDAPAFGAKAANLGELHRVLPARHRTEGFGIPLSAYVAFMASNGLDTQVEELLADERIHQDRHHLDRRLKALRDAIKAAPVPDALFARIRTAAIDALGEASLTQRLRFRSSTNAEDLEALSGAGLYDSKSGCIADDEDEGALGPSRCLSALDAASYQSALAAAELELAAHPERSWLAARIADYRQELSEKKSARSALAKVWASLWTLRAFEEREHYGLDHRQVFMGIAVNPAFVGEELDAVAVTNAPVPSGLPLYRVVTQVAEVSVVRPDDPTAVPETLSFRRGEDEQPLQLAVQVRSSFAEPGQESLWTSAQLDVLAQLLFDVHDHFEARVYPDLRPLALDLEIKRTRAGEISIKQARPYPLPSPAAP